MELSRVQVNSIDQEGYANETARSVPMIFLRKYRPDILKQNVAEICPVTKFLKCPQSQLLEPPTSRFE